ncbi:hypothetical protein U0070_017920 [Myodes glareolus]|uniref:Vanin C-terminal domain-containing protein n=1 Tax=Myodes glareolus TaxID=447135 RepID=A0AAW0K7T0_MYOGA
MLTPGSAIYSPEAGCLYHYDMETESGLLLLPELKSRPRQPSSPAEADWDAYTRSIQPFSSEQADFPGMIYFDEFSFTQLLGSTGNYTVCQKDLCCLLTYKTSENRMDEAYVLGVFDGPHTVEGQYYLQVTRDGRLRSRGGAPLPVLMMALYGRVFEKDPPRLGQVPGKIR